jgi:ATP-dependent helicase/nuclease subunit A
MDRESFSPHPSPPPQGGRETKWWQVRDKATREYRPARAGDVVILFRTLNDAAAYESALVEEGLDYYEVGGTAYFAQQEVLDVINLLSAIEDPCDALALAATLRGPFGCVSDDGLYWLATASAGDLTGGLEEWNRIRDLSAEDRKRAGRLYDLLSRWRQAKDRVPIASLLDRALDESGYEAALVAEFLGPRKRANVRKLVRLARRFDEQGGFTLADFVAKLRLDLRNGPHEEQAATTDEHGDAVRLMTIHQAKGLEFPVVILADLGREAPRTSKSVVFHRDLGVVTKPSEDDLPTNESDDGDSAGKSLGMAVYRNLEENEEEQEAYRLFYVAATRAQDVLVLSAGLGPDEDVRSPAMRLLASRFERTTGVCSAKLPAGWTRPAILITSKLPPLASPRPARRRFRPKRLAVSRLIERTTAATEATLTKEYHWPRLLDLTPAVSLSPSSARLDALVRAILADPDACNRERLAACAHRAARLQAPAASAQLVAEAIDVLSTWLDTPLAREIGDAAEIHRAVPWTIAWPVDSPEPTVYEGQIDFLFRDSAGDWCLAAMSDAAVSETRERLRILLSARAARELGVTRIARGWRIRLGPHGGVSREDRFGKREIERAIQVVLGELSRLG